MKITKRMKNALLQAFAVNLFFIICFSCILFFYSYPNAKIFFSMTKELEETSDVYNKIKKDGLSLGEAKKMANNQNINSNIALRDDISDFSPQLFSSTFTNTGSLNYSDFLEEVNNNIILQKQTPQYIERQKTLSQVLPIYSSGNKGENILSDFYFINYIEKLLYTFNLSGTDSIGISSLEKVDELKFGDSDESDGGLVGDQIYKIPITLSVVGRKSDIAEFIHFLENVGSVSISKEGIHEYSDDFFEKIIEGNQGVEGYNIYKNQLSVIESITFPEYPDSGTTEAGGDLLSTMLDAQSRQRFEAEIDISFFVAGVPLYQVKTYIDEFYTDFDELSKEIEALSAKVSGEKGIYTDSLIIESVPRVQSLYALMLIFSEEIEEYRTIGLEELNETSYDIFSGYKTKLTRIEEVFLELNKIFIVK